MILRLYSAYKTGKTIYTRILKPVYEKLKENAEAFEAAEELKKKNRKKKKNNVVNQKPKRSRKRQANP